MNLLAALFMAQLLYVIGVGGVQVGTTNFTQTVLSLLLIFWQRTNYAYCSVLYTVLPQNLIRPDFSFHDGQDSVSVFPGYDTLQSPGTFRRNMLPPFSVLNTSVLLGLIVDHSTHTLRGHGSLGVPSAPL
jgi:hypothetical protein